MLEQGFQQASSLWSAVHWLHQLPSVTFLPKRTLDLGLQLLWLVQAADSMVPKSPSGMICQFTRSWGMCVQPTVSLAKIQLHNRAHVCTPRYVTGVPREGCSSLPSGGWAALLWTTANNMRCETFELGMQNALGLFVPTANSHWQLPITYYTNKSCGNGNWYKFLLFSHANVLLLGVSSDLAEIACTFSPRQNHVFFKAMMRALLFFYSEAQWKRFNVQFVECRSEVINSSFWNGLN